MEALGAIIVDVKGVTVKSLPAAPPI